MSAGRRVTLEPVEFWKLSAAHGEIFRVTTVSAQRVREVQQQGQHEVAAAQHAFDAQLATLGATHQFDPAAVVQWDKETCELILKETA